MKYIVFTYLEVDAASRSEACNKAFKHLAGLDEVDKVTVHIVPATEPVQMDMMQLLIRTTESAATKFNKL